MLRVVLPLTLAALPSVDVITIKIVLIEIIVAVKIVVVVDVDVAVIPIAIAPVATPRTPGGGTQRNSRAPHQSCPWHVTRISVGIVGILSRSSSINDRGVVRRDVNYVGIGLLNFNHLLARSGGTAPDRLGLHNLL